MTLRETGAFSFIAKGGSHMSEKRGHSGEAAVEFSFDYHDMLSIGIFYSLKFKPGHF
jgi:hypothetical protein